MDEWTITRIKTCKQSDGEQMRELFCLFDYSFGTFETSLIHYHTQMPGNRVTVVFWGLFVFCLFVVLVWEKGVWFFFVVRLFGCFYCGFNSKISVANV